ncbi:DUF3108 domain-containing protein [Undibacterium sp. LX40W]|uniref:DUF3108 domain-containing protein n=1 Tax=Undibacterium nitidum TaxID=2762298 RepID=A0A923HN10_9BURK|nr:DUF3108 domain-containing protein [Undibacterium nitidum]MBC3882379.1 DUF3108 domain-containing protein [Undibacterium nitidum]MBC3892660.1 DUF3108 domain-containing protein [Undibacterium sp. LX40W]
MEKNSLPLAVRLQAETSAVENKKTEATQVPKRAPVSKQIRANRANTVEVDSKKTESKPPADNEITEKTSDPIVETVIENVDTSSATTPFSLRLPPSAEMKMEVSYTKVNGSPTQGVGSISWNTDGGSYSASVQVGIDLLLTTVNLLQINSEGSIDAQGLVPKLSTDTRRNRAMTSIHFNPEEKTITFSSSNKTVAMENGAQDAVSVLFQLAALGNSDSKQLSVGKEINIQVAEGRDAHMFTFTVVGEEKIDSKLEPETGKLDTIHLIRPPRPGSYNSSLEVWLAPTKAWYPVQIRNTESSGTVTTQNVVELRQKQVRPQ